MKLTTGVPSGSSLDFVGVTQEVIKELTGFEMKDTDTLSMPHMKYFEKLGSVLDKISKEDLEHYLTFRELLKLAPSTTTSMRDLFHQWNGIKNGESIPSPR